MEATEVLGTVTAAANSVKAVVEAIKTARAKAKGNAGALAALVDAHELALSLQSSLFEAKEQAFALQEENRQLRAQVAEYQARALDRENYERRKMGQTVVVVHKDHPDRPLCATCFEADRLVDLTELPRVAQVVGTHMCPTCKVAVKLK